MKTDYCDCRQGRDPCTCNKPMSNGEWHLLTFCLIGLFCIIVAAAAA